MATQLGHVLHCGLEVLPRPFLHLEVHHQRHRDDGRQDDDDHEHCRHGDDGRLGGGGHEHASAVGLGRGHSISDGGIQGLVDPSRGLIGTVHLNVGTSS